MQWCCLNMILLETTWVSHSCGGQRATLWPHLVCTDLQGFTEKMKQFRQIMIEELHNDSYLEMVVQYFRRLTVDLSRGRPQPCGISGECDRVACLSYIGYFFYPCKYIYPVPEEYPFHDYSPVQQALMRSQNRHTRSHSYTLTEKPNAQLVHRE